MVTKVTVIEINAGGGIPQRERHRQLIALARRSEEFGSMTELLSPEVLARPRDCSELAKALARNQMSPAERDNFNRLMRTPYGLP